MENRQTLQDFEFKQNALVANVTDLGFASYDRILFQDLNLNIKKGEVTAITGKSGAGKTVLLKIISSMEEQNEGKIFVNPKANVIFIPQELEDIDVNQDISILEIFKSARGLNTLEKDMQSCESRLASTNIKDDDLELYGDLMDQYEKSGGYNIETEIEKVLAGLGIDKENTININLNTKLSDVSSGQLRKILIGMALYSKADLILLDEPTSHLDVKAVSWLINYMNTSDSAIVITSNDSMVIDGCAKQTVGLTDTGRVFVFNGGFTEFKSKKDAIIEAELLESEHIAGKLDQLKKTDNMFRSKQAYKRSPDMAQVGRALASRMDRLKTEYENSPGSKHVNKNEKIRDLIFVEERRSGDHVISINTVKKSYDDYEAVDLSKSNPITIRRGEKWLLWGPNGSGKSTLAHMISDSLIGGSFLPDSGSIDIGSSIDMAYYSPDISPSPKKGLLVNALVQDDKGRNSSFVAILRFFGFSNSAIYNQDIKTLSSGEKKRLSLALIMAKRPNFIILDEPTGDYMTEEIKDRLSNAISKFEGTVILISHDQKFIEKTSIDYVLEMPMGKITIKN